MSKYGSGNFGLYRGRDVNLQALFEASERKAERECQALEDELAGLIGVPAYNAFVSEAGDVSWIKWRELLKARLAEVHSTSIAKN